MAAPITPAKPTSAILDALALEVLAAPAELVRDADLIQDIMNACTEVDVWMIHPRYWQAQPYP